MLGDNWFIIRKYYHDVTIHFIDPPTVQHKSWVMRSVQLSKLYVEEIGNIANSKLLAPLEAFNYGRPHINIFSPQCLDECLGKR